MPDFFYQQYLPIFRGPSILAPHPLQYVEHLLGWQAIFQQLRRHGGMTQGEDAWTACIIFTEYPPWNQHGTCKRMVGILVSSWDGLFSGAMLVLGRVHPGKLTAGGPKNGGGWKMTFLFNWVIFRFQSLIFRGVELTGGCQMLGTTKTKEMEMFGDVLNISAIWWVRGCWEHGCCCVVRTLPKGFWWMWMSTLTCSLFCRRFQNISCCAVLSVELDRGNQNLNLSSVSSYL